MLQQVQADVDVVRAVRAKYPGCRIGGAGEWGITLRCFGGVAVHLTADEHEARRLAAKNCNAPTCTNRHAVERFKAVRFHRMDNED